MVGGGWWDTGRQSGGWCLVTGETRKETGWVLFTGACLFFCNATPSDASRCLPNTASPTTATATYLMLASVSKAVAAVGRLAGMYANIGRNHPAKSREEVCNMMLP